MMDNEKESLVKGIGRIHTTEMGLVRIADNLGIGNGDIVGWCRSAILDKSSTVSRMGKNWYVSIGDCVLTVNVHSYTVITAHRRKGNKA